MKKIIKFLNCLIFQSHENIVTVEIFANTEITTYKCNNCPHKSIYIERLEND